MNERGPSLLVSAELACFRRGEFVTDFVSYDVLPPLHARRVVDGVLVDAARWSVERIYVVAPIETDWETVETSSGSRRVLALRRPCYLIELANRLATSSQPLEMLSKFEVHLGLAEHPAQVEPLTPDKSVPLPIDVSFDLGWMPVAFGRGKPRRTFFQRLRLEHGMLDLQAQGSTTLAC